MKYLEKYFGILTFSLIPKNNIALKVENQGNKEITFSLSRKVPTWHFLMAGEPIE
jgi:hypothetical protein